MRTPWCERGRGGGGADAGVDPAGERHLAEAGAGGSDERGIERDGRQGFGQQVLEVPKQAGAEFGVVWRGIGCLPILQHPVLDERRVERAGAAQHQVDPRLLIKEVGASEAAAHLRFQAPD